MRLHKEPPLTTKASTAALSRATTTDSDTSLLKKPTDVSKLKRPSVDFSQLLNQSTTKSNNKKNYIKEGFKSVVGPAALLGIIDEKRENNCKKDINNDNMMILQNTILEQEKKLDEYES